MSRSSEITIESVALWCLASVPLAVLIALAIAPQADPSSLMIWVGAKAVTAVVAVLAWSRRKQASWALPLARLALLLSALCWGTSGMLFGSFSEAMYNLPALIAIAGVASAAVWMFGGQLWLVISVLVLVLTPALFHLLLGSRPDWAAAAIIVFLVVANLLVSRRVASILLAEAAAGGGEHPVSTTGQVPEQLSGARLNAIADKELTEMRAELERRRNLEGELNAARQAAESAAMAKGEFLATMSHEMRTPLNGIIPLLEILRDTRLEPDQREYLNTAYQSARHLLRIIDDILDYSKIEAGKLELETTGINLRELTDSVVRLMEKNAEAKGLRLSATIDPGVRLAVRGDPVRLRQVLANLVSNGIKFTDKGSITIQVSKRGETRTHSELLFVVRDTGMGIDPVVAEKLFRPFSQADASTTRNFGGTGLGLVICKRIVDLMGGKIGLKSELGKGSIFWFSVPMLKAIGDMASTRRTLDGARALIVSSDQRLVQRLVTFLQNWGLAQISTNTTADALSKLKSSATLGENWAFDVCVVDFASMRNTAPALVRNVVREPSMERLKLVYLAGEEPVPADVQLAGRSAAIDSGFTEGELQSVFNRVLEIDQPGEQRVSLIEQAQRLGAESAPAAPAAQLAGPVTGHVLLVEDNPVNRQVAQKLLSLIGLSHDHAENGKLALEMASATSYDAVLMDCQMPVMDGYTATRTRRMLEEERGLGRLPIIAMTANAMAGDREKCLAAGMDDYLSKPLNRGLLEQTLRKWLPGDARSQKPGPATRPEPARAQPEAVLQTEPVKLRERGPAIDEQIVAELLEVMGSEFTALVRVYLEDTPKNLKALDKAAEAGDVHGMTAPAHSLKSTSANLGAMQLSDISKQIEHGARQGTLKDPLAKAREASVEFQRVAAALEALLGRVGD
jgi:signal transduction histidine kinase/CheY-like chemotaxis protein/HPt (histidine-containing phosphotransfer) domain-containing protein